MTIPLEDVFHLCLEYREGGQVVVPWSREPRLQKDLVRGQETWSYL